MKKEALENVNSELFESFNPNEEPWIVGGSKSGSASGSVTSTPSGPDGGGNVNFDWGFVEEEIAS